MSAATCPRCGLAATGARCARCGADLTRAVAAPRPSSDRAELVLTAAADGSSGQRWTVTTDAAVVGRAPTADVRIDDRSISRSHCRITRENDEFFIEDAGGQNGTFVNGERVRAKTRIANGSRIGVASVELVATVISPAKVAAAAPAGHTVVVDVSEALAAADAMPVIDLDVVVEPSDAAPEVVLADEASVDGEVETTEETAGDVADEVVEEASADEIAAEPESATAISLDELTAAAAAFWTRFEVARSALLRFRDRYVEIGGRDLAIELAAQSMLVQEQPADPDVLLSLGQYAKRIEELALAAVDLVDSMTSGALENVATPDAETSDGGSSSESEGE